MWIIMKNLHELTNNFNKKRYARFRFEKGFPYFIINMDMGPYDYKLAYN